jgi:hypothetical protein
MEGVSLSGFASIDLSVSVEKKGSKSVPNPSVYLGEGTPLDYRW